MTVADAVIYGLPWWVQALAGAALAVFALFLFAGFAGSGAALRVGVVAAALLAGLAHGRRERQRGWSDHEEKEARNAEDAIERARRARAAADASGDAASGGLRDDGFRRD